MITMKTSDEYEYTTSITELAWMNLSDTFRHACSLYHNGKEADAMRLAQEQLPALIEQWSEASHLSGSARRLRLMSMFVEEGRKVGESALAQKMLSSYMSSQALLNRRTKEMLQKGNTIRTSGLTGGIRLIGNVPSGANDAIQVPVDFDGDLTALQMIR